jgi:hypothetical protein
MKLAFSFLFIFSICLLASVALLNPKHLAGDAVVQDTSESGPVRMIRFVVSEDGLYPARIRVDYGLLNIVFDDRTSKSDGLLIQALQGERRSMVTQISRSQERTRNRTLIKLPAGRYLISDASQPSHTAELIVNP